MRSMIGLALAAVLIFAPWCAAQHPQRLQSDHLPNLVWVHNKVLSGGLPEDDAAFDELTRRGVKTIISVDGARPDVETARRHGLRYVHLPHGYDGIPDGRISELAKAVRDLPGTVYIHCHHGKHRSAAAASVACVAAGLIPSTDALNVLELAGTSTNYRGLYQSARQAQAIEKKQLNAMNTVFRSTAEIPPLADAMVHLEHTFAHVKSISQSNWQTPEDHPDLDPVHEVLLLREHFTELLRSEAVQQEGSQYKQMIRESETAAQHLQTLLEQPRSSTRDSEFNASASENLRQIGENCQACHARYRDVPLSEK